MADNLKIANETAIKTQDPKNVVRNELNTNKIIFGHMFQKIIVDKLTHKSSEFLVFANSDLTDMDWVGTSRFDDISSKLGSIPLEYPLKKARKGNEDEGRKAVQGKALKLTIIDDTVSIGVYTQTYGSAWILSHSHTIDKSTFDAYALVVKNDFEVSKLEKENRSPENFSLNLG